MSKECSDKQVVSRFCSQSSVSTVFSSMGSEKVDGLHPASDTPRPIVGGQRDSSSGQIRPQEPQPPNRRSGRGQKLDVEYESLLQCEKQLKREFEKGKEVADFDAQVFNAQSTMGPNEPSRRYIARPQPDVAMTGSQTLPAAFDQSPSKASGRKLFDSQSSQRGKANLMYQSPSEKGSTNSRPEETARPTSKLHSSFEHTAATAANQSIMYLPGYVWQGELSRTKPGDTMKHIYHNMCQGIQ